MAEHTAVPKICIHCGQDCAGRPRFKDAQGRYACGECVEKLKARRAATRPAAAPSRAGGPGAGGASAEPDEGLNPLPVADDEALPASLLDDAPRMCPNCAIILARDAVICMSCGYNTRTGKLLATDRPAGEGRSCVKCGYSLEGLRTPRCPECGTINRPANKRGREKRAAESAVRSAYLKPLVMFVAGFLFAAAVTAGRGGEQAAVEYAIVFGIEYVIGVLVFWLCSVAWIGFDSPLRLMVLQIAGVYGATDAAASVLAFFPLPLITWPILIVIYIGLLMEVLDLDLVDAALLGVITFLAKVSIGLAIAFYVFANT